MAEAGAMKSIGLLVMAGGVVLVLVGAATYLGWFSWFGRLPGEVRVEGERVRVFFPVATMIVVSVVLTVLLNLAVRLLGK